MPTAIIVVPSAIAFIMSLPQIDQVRSRYFTSAWIIMFLAILVHFLRIQGFIPNTLGTLSLAIVLIVFESFVLASGLAAQTLAYKNQAQAHELAFLRAQIQPHFLFNTLNTGIQLAVVEEADKTRNYLERLTRLMRYSFRDLETPVALAEEIECLQSYLYLMSIRFPGVFTFRVSVESPADRAIMPKMIIQPLVENAIRHGFRDKTEGAALTVQADLQGEDVRILIEDNGAGITEDRVHEISKPPPRVGIRRTTITAV